MFAEINNENLIKFPYDYGDLKNDNPHSSFDSKSLDELYKLTEKAQKTGNKLVFVEIEEFPEIPDGMKVGNLSSVPVFVNGKWVLKWNILEVTPEEVLQKQKNHEEWLSKRSQTI